MPNDVVRDAADPTDALGRLIRSAAWMGTGPGPPRRLRATPVGLPAIDEHYDATGVDDRAEVAVCAHCGELRPPCARWPEGPVCEACYRAALSRRGTCGGCGERRRLVSPPGSSAVLCCDCAGVPTLARCADCGIEDRPYADGRCVRCALAERSARLLGGPRAELAGLHHAIVSARQPYSAHNWLRRSGGAAILADIAAGVLALTHAYDPASTLYLAGTEACPARMRFVIALDVEGQSLHDADLRAAIVKCLTGRLNTAHVAVTNGRHVAGTPT